MKRIVLCADDYGQAEAISQGIVTLIQNGRLSATSCMVNTPLWSQHAKWLLPLQNWVDVGLHFNLTEGKALSSAFIKTYGETLPSLNKLMRQAFFRRLDPVIIATECQAQIDCFVDQLGFLPRFIDGHHHIHQFPIIRDALLRVYDKYLRSANSYVRLVNEKIRPIDFVKDIKKIAIRLLGSNTFKQSLQKYHVPHNASFAGMYEFSRAGQYSALFPRFLAQIEDRGVVMCHPALRVLADNGDAISKARASEYNYLLSNQFLVDCHVQGVLLTKF